MRLRPERASNLCAAKKTARNGGTAPCRSLRVVLLFGLCTLGGEILPAEGAPREKELAQAKHHFDLAEIHFSLQEFDKALQQYRQAYELSLHPALLFNMAQCHRHLEEKERALFLFRRFLIAASPGEKQRQQAELIIKRLEVELQAKQKAEQAQPSFAPASRPVDGIGTQGAGRSARSAPPQIPLSFHHQQPADHQAKKTTVPLYRRWWFWTAVSVVVIGATTTAVVLTRPDDEPLPGTLAPVDYR